DNGQKCVGGVGGVGVGGVGFGFGVGFHFSIFLSRSARTIISYLAMLERLFASESSIFNFQFSVSLWDTKL
ncbi:MAG: hypothetical protein IJ882_04395, partial [Paludibacteraceae bacterium]|nr:hypothetical protein [Paludibacteraceae bacterium]